MADLKKKIADMYKMQTRFSNFGPVMTRLRTSGFRGMRDFDTTIDSPITALSGTNGSGKSTIIQLAACAYKKISTDSNIKRFYVNDFFTVSSLDPNTIEQDSFVEYHYATSIPGRNQIVTVRRAIAEWSGYKRQPERVVWYVGFTYYIPKVERKDFSIYQAQNITVGDSRRPDDEVLLWTKRILGNSYQDINFTTITHKHRQAEIGRLTRNGSQYSESNMGFGEGRVLYLVDILENSPSNSLILLEEPETSLHPIAQYNLSQYLLDVVSRKKHQLILSTHSESLLSGLPQESRKFMLRQENRVEVIDGISTTYATSFLTGNFIPALTICVEDEFAKVLATELIRRGRPQLLPNISIQFIGDTKAVAQAVSLLNSNSKNAVALRDGDKGEDEPKRLFKLPGNLAPEKEVIGCQSVKHHLATFYSIDVDAFLQENPELNHHSYFDEIAKCAFVHVKTLETECIRKYVDSLHEDEVEKITSIVENYL